MKIDKAYKEAEKLARTHYENFPVISLFVKRKLRKHIAVIYTFARTADDYADEGNFSSEERVKHLEQFEKDFTDSLNGKPKNFFWIALSNTINEFKINTKHFYALLKAFKQDVSKNRYQNFEEVLNYCEKSANPVGRIILELNNIHTEKAYKYSDKICTALQLTNFLQDVNIDLNKNRIYLPHADLLKFNLEEDELFEKKSNANFIKLMHYEINRVQQMFLEGEKLLGILPMGLRMQISFTVKGGELILQKIEKQNYDVLNQRPKLSKLEYFLLMFKSFL